MSDHFTRVSVRRVGRNDTGSDIDAVAVEEPLEIRLHGRPFAVIMRTPGADRELAAGFLFSEGVIGSASEVGAVERCRHPHYPELHNIVDVFVVGAARDTLEAKLAERRNVLATSSCGLCGRVAIECLEVRAQPLAMTCQIDPEIAASLPDTLRQQQIGFDYTGGLHAAGLFSADGTLRATAEDVGRHNAVDKVIGAQLLEERLPLRETLLAVSGRTSFEIVQKAWLAGIELVCAVSAPSSLAIELAERAGITLLGFAREGGFNIYSHPKRIRGGG
jgi:FdhD protein